MEINEKNEDYPLTVSGGDSGSVSSGDSLAVSGGDAVPMVVEMDNTEIIELLEGNNEDLSMLLEQEGLDNAEIIELLNQNNEYLSLLLEEEESQTATIWEKPLSDFSVLEGLLVILLFVILFWFVDDIIRGIVKWRK